MNTRALFSPRPGFALPMVILVITFMTAALIAAFARLRTETQTVDGDRGQLIAFSLAQAGLEAKMAANDTTDSTRFTFSQGRADVRATKIKTAAAATDTSIWLIKSTGIVNGGTTANPAARRTVAQISYKMAVQLQVMSAWTSLTGLQKNGGSGSLAGVDHCGSQPMLAGVAVPTGMYNQNGGSSVPTGSPPIRNQGTQTQMQDSVKIDWNAIVNQGAIPADITIPPSGWPSFSNANYWPVIYVANGASGTATIPNGRGFLIIEGNATMSGSSEWDGVILMGGNLTSNGNNTVYGAVVTGLNVKLGLVVDEGAIGNGTKTYGYDSCAIANATNGMARIKPFTNAWIDNYSAWQ